MRIAIMCSALAIVAGGLSASASAQDVDLMQYADPNGDGKVTPEEHTAFFEQAWGYFTQGADPVKVASLDPASKGIFAGLTPDANGMVSKQVFTAAIPGRFKAADKNGDGTLDRTEFSASMNPKG